MPMCRHLAYLGPPASIAALLTGPPYGLGRQAWAPRRQSHGTMNVDGFGIGWYADGDPVPAGRTSGSATCSQRPRAATRRAPARRG